MASNEATLVITHPTIGRVRGIEVSQMTRRFLGLQYATLKDRFSRADMVRYPSEGLATGDAILDATRFGPTALNPPNACEIEQDLLQHSLPFSPMPMSDTECLTLNITSSMAAGMNGKLLPVLVFVHGGGFIMGSSSYPQNDLARITVASMEMGMPIISVSINYRVGAAGFLSSPEMEAAGYKPNNGLDDQRLALLWIQDHIAGFGGNRERVTFLGESAGATSGFYHLHAPEPYFQQFVSMSGTSLLRPRPTAAIWRSFQLMSKALGAEDADGPREKVNTFLNTSSDEFVKKLGRPYTLGPILDEDIIPKVTTFESLRSGVDLTSLFPGMQRCKRLLIGDCQFDGMIWASRLAHRQDVLPQTLEKCLAQILDPLDKNLTRRLFLAYRLDISSPVNTSKSTQAVLEFGNDITYLLPVRQFAKEWPGAVFSADSIDDRASFLYHFNARNPWPGRWKDHCTHDLDLTFALQNYREHLSPGQQKCADRMAHDLVRFVHGKDPWPAFHGKGPDCPGAMVYSVSTNDEKDESGYVEGVNGIVGGEESARFNQRTGRRELMQTIVKEEYYDKLFEAWYLFMLGPQ